jgi:hypothetical protein
MPEAGKDVQRLKQEEAKAAINAKNELVHVPAFLPAQVRHLHEMEPSTPGPEPDPYKHAQRYVYDWGYYVTAGMKTPAGNVTLDEWSHTDHYSESRRQVVYEANPAAYLVYYLDTATSTDACLAAATSVIEEQPDGFKLVSTAYPTEKPDDEPITLEAALPEYLENSRYPHINKGIVQNPDGTIMTQTSVGSHRRINVWKPIE